MPSMMLELQNLSVFIWSTSSWTGYGYKNTERSVYYEIKKGVSSRLCKQVPGQVFEHTDERSIRVSTAR